MSVKVKKYLMPFDMATVISVHLFTQNHGDSVLLSRIFGETKYSYVDSSRDSILVAADEIRAVLGKYYANDIRYISGLRGNQLRQKVNSAYFLSSLVNSMQNLNYVNIKLDNSKKFSRRMDIDVEAGTYEIEFLYNVTLSKLNFGDYVFGEDLDTINNFLVELGLVGYDASFRKNSYITTTTQNLMKIIDNYTEVAETSGDKSFYAQYELPLLIIGELVSDKVLADNGTIVIVTDYPVK